ncbi:MAG: hypothetical protein PHQ59_04755 [Candidatus Daviesbacteria bacterium]|nr:hypothetical protein [Candidatus Daviesbacteria bacterium]
MTATAHALIGGAVASTISNPELGLSLAFISHPLLDLIPHWDFANNWRAKDKFILFIEASADLTFGVLLSYILFGQNVNLWYFFGCIFVSEVWDIIEAPYWFLNWKFPPISWIYNVQSKMQGKAALPWGIITQILTVALATLILQKI